MEELVDVAEAAAYLAVRPETLATWRCDGVGPVFVRIGAGRGAIRYRKADLRAYVESRAVEPSKVAA